MFASDAGLRIGTSSWSSKDWVGPFYPPGTKPAEYIAHYASVFDTVEIDATFYRMPTAANADAWRRRTPEEFRFAAKVPRVVTHDKVLHDAGPEMLEFLEVMSALGPRLGPVLLQFPYFNKRAFSSVNPFLELLDRFLGGLPAGFRIAVEVRNRAWIRPPLIEVCRAHGAALAWVEHAWMPGPEQWRRLTEHGTADFAYVRWLGDRKKIEEITTSWDKPVIDCEAVLSRWVQAVRGLREARIEVFGYFNNHFAGHAPDSVRLFQRLYERGL
jgi:uncharacterized protein YecE (DUF72 family)